MARIVKPLTDTEIKTAKLKDKEYTLHDGDGLQLIVTIKGKKHWQFRYYRPITKGRVKVSFGSYPSVSLADARKTKDKYRALIAKNIDPQVHFEQEKQNLLNQKQNTFKSVAKDWFEVKKTTVKEDTAKDIWRSLELHIFNSIGNIPISDLKRKILVDTIKPIEQKGSLETVKRISQRIHEIFVYAMNIGIINATPTSELGKAFLFPKKKHMLTILPKDLPYLVNDMISTNITLSTRLLFFWQLLTMTRPNESAATKWSEIDLANKVWVIPAERMKMNREQKIPLSQQALHILYKMQSISSNNPYVFASNIHANKPMNSQTVNAALKRTGYKGKLVSHGLRSIASTAANESGIFNSDVIEAALSHTDKNSIRSSYNRTDYFELRKELMQWWADFVFDGINCSRYDILLSNKNILGIE